MVIDPEFMRGLNAVLLLALVLTCIGLAVAFASRSSAHARADRFSERVRLPYGTMATRESVVRRARVSSLTTALTLLVAIVLTTPLLLTPLATSPTFPIIAIMPALIATGFASAVVNVRERLFHPAPDAPRIARPRALSPRDYLSPVRRLLPWFLAACAVFAMTWMVTEWVGTASNVDGAFAATAIFAAAITAGVAIAVPVLDKLVLAQPQPATDTLELAWDDAFRATALSALRLSAALAAWMTCALAIGAVWIGSDALFASFATQVPTWGMIALQFVYPSTGRRLRAELYPDWLRQPTPVGGTA